MSTAILEAPEVETYESPRPQLSLKPVAVTVDNSVKQVIVIRKDLKMRRGKEIAQGAHAAMMFLVDIVLASYRNAEQVILSREELAWMKGGFAKIVLQVDNEEELFKVFNHAYALGLKVHMITDSGKTEFEEPTRTCIAIGPHTVEKIDPVTKHLKLY